MSLILLSLSKFYENHNSRHVFVLMMVLCERGFSEFNNTFYLELIVSKVKFGFQIQNTYV